MKTIGTNIKYFRKKSNLTQRELASKCNLATGTIQQYELDKREPKTEILIRIANALQIELADLVSDIYTEKIIKNINNLNNIPDKIQSNVQEGHLVEYYRALNNIGKKEALKRVQELTYIPEYSDDDINKFE